MFYFHPGGLFVHLCACRLGLQCNYRSIYKRFQELPVQLYQIHAACKCRRLSETCLQNCFKGPVLEKIYAKSLFC